MFVLRFMNMIWLNWSGDEWHKAPISVMGAIINCIKG